MDSGKQSLTLGSLTIIESGDKWCLRVPGHVFPVLEASASEVVGYIRQNFTGKGRVEIHRETGEVEKLSVSALQ